MSEISAFQNKKAIIRITVHITASPHKQLMHKEENKIQINSAQREGNIYEMKELPIH